MFTQSLATALILPVHVIPIGKTNAMGFRDVALCIGHAIQVASDGCFLI